MPKIDLSQVDWYRRSRGTTVAGPSVSISKAGKVVVNHEAVGLLGEPEAVQVGIIQGSRGKVTLVLQAAQRSDAGALALTKQGATKMSVNTTKFLRERNLEKLFGTAAAVPDFDEDARALAVTF